MKEYEKRAKKYERQAVKLLRKNGSLLTCKNHINNVERVDSKYIYFRTKKSGGAINRIPRALCRRAITLLLYSRNVTRQQLAKIHHFNSFLMGWIRNLFVEQKQIASLQVLKNGVHRIVMKGTRFYFAGAERDPKFLQAIHDYSEAPGNWTLMSYWTLRNDKHEQWKKHVRKFGFKILLDSGEYSYFKLRERLQSAKDDLELLKHGSYEWNQKIIEIDELTKKANPISIIDYASFIKKHEDVLFGYFNLDVVGDANRSQINANYLVSQGLSPIPIWHPQSGLESLAELIEENHALIGIGGLLFANENEDREAIIERIFSLYPQQAFHLLGYSSTSLYKYPIHSCDSTTPIKGRRFLQVVTESGQLNVNEVQDWHEWNGEEALIYNIKQLSRLEEAYDGIQIELLTPPELTAGVQLTLF